MSCVEDLKIKFEHWRANKSTSSEAIPQELWTEVKLALGQVDVGILCKYLRVTKPQLRTHCGYAGQRIKPKNCGSRFIEIAPQNNGAGSAKYEVLFTVNNHPVTIKLASNNLLSVLRDLKAAL